jgi:hypothetical protein
MRIITRSLHPHSSVWDRERCVVPSRLSICLRWRSLWLVPDLDNLHQEIIEEEVYMVRSNLCRLAAHGFHQDRMKATTLSEALPPVSVHITIAASESELRAASLLRAKSFYVYPPERKFSGYLSRFFPVGTVRMLSSFLAADGVNHLSLSHQSIIHHTGLSISNISQVFNTLTCFSHASIKRDAWQLCKQRGYTCNDFQVYCTSR